MSTRPPIVLRQRRDLGQTIGDSFTFLRQNGKTLWKSLLLICIPPMLIGMALMSSGMYATFSNMGNQMEATMRGEAYDPVTSLSMILMMLVAYPFFIFMGVMMEAVTHEYIGAYEKNEHAGITTGQLWRRSIGQFWHYFGILFLNGIAVLVGLVLCILPGIWIAISFIVAPMSRAAERLSVTDALNRSFKLTHTNWWWTLLIVIVLYFIMAAIQMMAFLPLYIVAIFSMVTGIDPESGFTGPPTSFFVILGAAYLVLFVISILVFPLFRIGTGLWYYSLVEGAESQGLKDRVGNLENL